MDIFAYLEQWRQFSESVGDKNTCQTNKNLIQRFLWRGSIHDPHQITYERLQEYFNDLAARYAVRSVLNHKSAISCFCFYLIKIGALTSNPCKLLKLPPLAMGPPDFLNEEEIEIVIEAAEESGTGLPIQAAIFSGMRRDELRCLQWQQIDMDRKLIQVCNKDSFTVKTGKNRLVPIMDRLHRELKKQMETVFPRPHPEHYIFFRNDPSRCFRSGSWDRILKPIKNLFPGRIVTWRILRHTFASILVQRGVSIYKVSIWLGNTMEVCDQYYCNAGKRFDPEVNRVLPECLLAELRDLGKPVKAEVFLRRGEKL